MSPIILEPRETRIARFDFSYSSRNVFECNEIGRITDEGRREVEWLLNVTVYDSFGRAYGLRPPAVIATEEIAPDGVEYHVRAPVLNPITVLDVRDWLGELA